VIRDARLEEKRPFRQLFPALGRLAVRQEESFEVAAYPGCQSSLAEDSPVQHRAAVDLLNQAGQPGGVAFYYFACGHGFVEELLRFFADGPELSESDGAELRVGQIDLQVGQAVGHGFGSGGKPGALHEELNEGLERRFVFRAGGSKLFRHACRGSFNGGEEQASLGSKPLNERCGHDAGFPGDVGKGQVGGAAAPHHARGGGEDFRIGSFARARRHFS
jgi:hypothetical protein